MNLLPSPFFAASGYLSLLLDPFVPYVFVTFSAISVPLIMAPFCSLLSLSHFSAIYVERVSIRNGGEPCACRPLCRSHGERYVQEEALRSSPIGEIFSLVGDQGRCSNPEQHLQEQDKEGQHSLQAFGEMHVFEKS